MPLFEPAGQQSEGKNIVPKRLAGSERIFFGLATVKDWAIYLFFHSSNKAWNENFCCVFLEAQGASRTSQSSERQTANSWRQYLFLFYHCNQADCLRVEKLAEGDNKTAEANKLRRGIGGTTQSFVETLSASLVLHPQTCWH